MHRKVYLNNNPPAFHPHSVFVFRVVLTVNILCFPVRLEQSSTGSTVFSMKYEMQINLSLRFSPVNIIPPTLHTDRHLHAVLTRRTNGRSLGTFQKAKLFWKSEELERKVL